MAGSNVYGLLVSILVILNLQYGLGETVLGETSDEETRATEALRCDLGSCYNRCNSSEIGIAIEGQNSKRRYLTCRCTADCIIFGDCCSDFFDLCLHTNLTTLTSDIKTISEVESMLQGLIPHYVPEMLAMFLYKSCEDTNSEVDFWMVSTCPLAGDHDALKCSGTTWDPLGTVPVSMISNPSFAFKNKFCASCHGFNEEDVIIWESRAICEEDANLKDLKYDEILKLIRSDLCYVSSTVPANTQPRVCERTYIDLCPLFSENETLTGGSIRCRSYTHNLVTSSGVDVRNQDCADCFADPSVSNGPLVCEKKPASFLFHGRLIPDCEDMSCEGRCASVPRNGSCGCDDVCLLFGDCCFDYVAKCLITNLTLLDMQNETVIWDILQRENIEEKQTSVTKGENVSETTDFTALRLLYLQFRQCVFRWSLPEMIWMIAKCPAENRTSECEDVHFENNRSLIAPASHVEDGFLVFKNIFCGVCHGIPKEKLQMWDTFVYCQEHVSIIKSEMEGASSRKCQLIVDDTRVEGTRSCNPDDVFLGGTNRPPLQQNWCQWYRYPVLQGSNQYRNPHCTDRAVSCQAEMNTNRRARSGFMQMRGGLSILFNFKDDQLKFVVTSDANTPSVCEFNEVFDYRLKKCVRLQCKHGKTARDGACVHNGTWIADVDAQMFPNGSKEYILKVSYVSSYSVEAQNIKEMFQQNRFLSRVIQVKETKVVSQLILNKTNDHILTKDEIIVSIESTFETAAPFQYWLKKLFRALYKVFFKTPKGSFNDHNLTLLNVTVQNFENIKNLSCQSGAVFKLNNAVLEVNDGLLFAKEGNRFYTLNKIAFILKLQHSNYTVNDIWVCRIPLKCDVVSYNLSDFIFSGSSLRNIFSDQVIENNSYFIDGDTVLACHNLSYSNHFETFFQFDHVQDVLTYVTSGISILSLTITLAVYCILPQLRNLPGRLTMSLSASLLVAQALLLLIHAPKGILCKIHAVALHFFWLCSFMWMGMMSVNLAITFNRNSSQQSSARTTSYRKYACLAIGLPFIIVTISALLDFLQIEGVFIGYGMFGTCWIANPRASLFVFGVPLALVLIINILAFGLTLFSIERSLKLSKDLESTKKDKGKAFIYGKLFIIMGLSWISSFIAAFTDINFLWYIFIILNGLQGFCIFTSFVCTDRVRRLLLRKWGRNDAPSVYTTSTGTSRTSGIKSGL